MATASEVLSAAMTLSSGDRAAVAQELLLTLEAEDINVDTDQAWADEVRRRLQAIRDGRASLRPWDEALADIRRSIQSQGQA